MVSAHSEITPEFATLVDMLRQRAARQPGQEALNLLGDDPSRDARVTYEELDLQARRIGAWLQSLHLRGERALLLFAPGLDYVAAFFGCLYAGVVAVPAYPPRPNRSAERLGDLVKDSGATVALTSRAIRALAELSPARIPDSALPTWLVLEDCPPGLELQWRDPQVGPADLAFLQYTSGSTTSPRGVMLAHRNLLHNLASIREICGHTAQSRGVIWLPPYHDMGLIGGILQPLYVGFPCQLMAPLTFLAKPYRWLQTIHRFGATVSGGPNFAYDLCLEKVTPEQRDTLDLSDWQIAFTGAEPIRHETLRRFAEVFASCGFRAEAFYPCYGLAEATLMVAGSRKLTPTPTLHLRQADLERNRIAVTVATDPDRRTLVGCGRSFPDQHLVIADPQTLRQCHAGQVGEIWVRGPSVALGYWNRSEETTQTFQAFLADTREGPFLRTGDLGFLQREELFVTGRRKDLIIIRGRNLYPQDLEATVEQCHPALQRHGSVAIAVSESGLDYLVILAEVSRHQGLDLEEVMARIRREVADEFEVSVHSVVLLKRNSVHRTSSGKKQRSACLDAFLKYELDILAEWNAETSAATSCASLTRVELLAAPANQRPTLLLTAMQTEVARRLRQDPARVDADQPLTHLGLDSLTALELKNSLEFAFDVPIPITDILRGPSLRQLAARLLVELDKVFPQDMTDLDLLVRQLQQLSDEEVRQQLAANTITA